jgi:hypothetical protein
MNMDRNTVWKQASQEKFATRSDRTTSARWFGQACLMLSAAMR